MARWLSEPLLHFLLLGALLFGLDAALARSGPGSERRIVIDDAVRARLGEAYERATGRRPTPQGLEGQLDKWRAEGGLYREGPARDNQAMVRAAVDSYLGLRRFVADRPGHDRRYAIDTSKSRRELGWAPTRTFEEGITSTVAWYLAHRDWCEAVQNKGYQRQRLGLSGEKA